MNIQWRLRPGFGRAAAVLAMGSLVVGLANPASADEKASRKCRTAIAKSGASLAKTVLTNIDKCHGAQNKVGAAQGACNDVTTAQFDPKAKYPASKIKIDQSIDKACLAGDPVLANYPGADATAALVSSGETVLTGNSVLTLGNGVLPAALQKCQAAVAKSRSGIINEIIKNSTKCQGGIDKVGTTFGAIDTGCVDAGAKAVAKAQLGIPKACPSVDPIALGSCSPFPGCVIDSAVQAGKTIARDIYSTPASPVCGDGSITYPEQCDDNGTTPGDGCNASCELEGNTCAPFLATRTVTVSVTADAPFAAADITIDYPQFQSGLVGTGQSSLVQNAVAVNQGTPGNFLFLANDRETDLKMGLASSEDEFGTGQLLTITFDGCLAINENICNRNQNVISCCNGDGDDPGGANCAFAPPVCTTFPSGTIGSGSPEDCCPADNACVTQVGATICSIANAVTAVGNPVNVTCSVNVVQ
jgi:cysteine-rich repeat protein